MSSVNSFRLIITLLIAAAATAFYFPVIEKASSMVMTYKNHPSPSIVLKSSFPFRTLRSADQIMQEFVNSVESWDSSDNSHRNQIPVDVRETKEFYEIYADVPGVNKDATKLSIEDHILTISTERNPVKSEEQDSFCRVERFSGTYSRSLRLPDDADEENITASFKDGVMTIRIARIPEDIARGRRTIPVSFE